MTRQVVRLYALVVGSVVFFVAWAAIAAHPWVHAPATTADARVTALSRREQRLRLETLRVRNIVARRFARYRVELRARRRAIANEIARRASAARPSAAATIPGAPPAVRVVTLPPLVVTRTS